MSGEAKTLKQRLKNLELHLKKENPVLVSAVQTYRQLDQVGRSLGLLNSEQSFATQISWWPMISVLGTFSAGKSTFINHYLGESIQSTGNQAVDDKFTVICFGGEQGSQALPGSALDADPRFPFYQISNELEKVAIGEGRRVDSYLQLKTSPSEQRARADHYRFSRVRCGLAAQCNPAANRPYHRYLGPGAGVL